MMSNDIRLGCVIMASGLGKRFGSNKLTAPFCGGPMIGRILHETEDLFFRRIAVTRHEDVAALCRDAGIEVILHDLPGRNDTVRLGLEALRDTVEGCMFCPGDMPLLKRASLARLCEAFAREPEFIWRLGEGAPVIFPAWAFEELACLPQGKGGGWVMQAHPEDIRSVEPDDPDALWDADTPEMLLELEQRFLKGETI